MTKSRTIGTLFITAVLGFVAYLLASSKNTFLKNLVDGNRKNVDKRREKPNMFI